MVGLALGLGLGVWVGFRVGLGLGLGVRFGAGHRVGCYREALVCHMRAQGYIVTLARELGCVRHCDPLGELQR